MYDLSNQVFGRLRVLYRNGSNSHKEALWHCVCDCGKEIDVNSYALRIGHTKSCGCFKSDASKRANTKHEGYGTLLYKTYYNMKTRCYNPNYYLFSRYGGRGIRICDEWLGEYGFCKFKKWSMEHGYKKGLSIERVDTNGDYCPENCTWVTMKQQQNNRSNNKILIIDGESHTMKQWSEITGTNYSTIQRRLRSGKSHKEAVFGASKKNA